MKKILQKLYEHQSLSKNEAKEVLLNIGNGNYNEHEIASFMTVFLMRSITINELKGFRDALLELAIPLHLDGIETIDIVGTGGDGKNTFNISTLACFIVAGASHKVTKHGNYAATSITGSSNVMEQLGYRFKNNSSQLKIELDEANICFLHAPLFHPALKIVAPIRKNLGIRTFFNLLGPIVNPAKPYFHLIGVYNVELARMYHYLLIEEAKQFTIIHSLDGYDEISLTADTKVITQNGEKIYTPHQLSSTIVFPNDIVGGNSLQESAKIFLSILQGNGTLQQNSVVLSNAAMSLYGTGKYKTYEDAYAIASESLYNKKALQSFNKLINLQ